MNCQRSPSKLFDLCVNTIADVFPMPLSQGDWERRKYRKAVCKLAVSLPDVIVELILCAIFGEKL